MGFAIERNPKTNATIVNSGNSPGEVVDKKARSLSEQVLKELQILNNHQEVITDERFREEDIER